MGNRIQYIDSLKGVLIILVVVGHFRYANYRYMTIVNDVIYSFHMPLFIFLSGYVVTELSFTKLAKRIRMLVLPFFFIGTLFSLCYKGNAFSWFQIANKHYFWYLLILTYCLISISLIQKILRIRPSNQKMSYLLGGVIAALLFVVDRFLPQTINNALSFHVLCVYYPFFLFGYISRNSERVNKVLNNNYLYTIALLLYVPLQYLYMQTKIIAFHAGPAICAIIILLQLFKRHDFGLLGIRLAYFGKNSLDIYLFHGFVLGLLNLEFFSLWASQTGNILIELVASVLISIIVSLICITIGRTIKQSLLFEKIIYGIW